jgi:predicted Zn finger-like uncharacterized protein
MIISCPSCMARYELAGSEDSLPPEGRSMRCGRCGNIWQTFQVDPPVEILPPDGSWGDIVVEKEPATPGPDDPEEQPAGARLIDDGSEAESGTPNDRSGQDDDFGSRAHRAAGDVASQARGRSSGGTHKLQGFILGIALALLVAALYYRTEIVRAVPSSAGLYELVGLQVNLRGLDFRDVAPHRIYEDGLPVLVIEGNIVNVLDTDVAVPALRLAVRGPSGEELYAWTIEPRESTVEAGGSMSFRTRLAAPPSSARNVKLRFVERTRQPTGIRP